MRRIFAAAIGLIIIVSAGWFFLSPSGPQPGRVTDEAMQAGLKADHFKSAAEDYFHDMDGGAKFTPEETAGRNVWLVWSGGNDRFWDAITKQAFGTFDLLKMISSADGLPYSRDKRWKYFGVVNEPCFEKPKGPDAKHFGLWLDQRRPDCAGGPDPFADESKYPGVKIGARGKDGIPTGSYYGEPTGIVGLRLFPNPAFDAEARRKWDSVRYYNDASYYQQKDLVRPYRVGMACSFCHVGPSPTNPPADPENPKWENLNSTVGAQYFWFDRVFVWNGDESNYILQLLHAYLPGTLDTSLVSTDNIVNPRTMNALYAVTPRLLRAKPYGRELLAGGQLDNKQFSDFDAAPDELKQLFDKPYVLTPRVLKDGSDSVGALGALNRVYLNIGLFSEEWLLHFNPFAGGQRITPIKIADAQKNSVYWQSTELQTILLAKFLQAAGKPDRLADLPAEKRAAYLDADRDILPRGKEVFAERCARCHSSKLPEPVVGMQDKDGKPKDCNGANYLGCWNDYWRWTKTDEFKTRMRDEVQKADFLDGNYLSTEFRIPLTLLQTNACSALARNALEGNIWDNFSSQSYKALPSVGEVSYQDPFTGEDRKFMMPAGGRGFMRPPSLISLWSTAPYLQNNSVGSFNPDPSIEARMKGFDEGIHEMLWPESRKLDAVLGGKGVGLIQRTKVTSWVKLPNGFLPGPVKFLRAPIGWILPGAFAANGDLQIGPIPKGTPVDLLGNFDPLPEERSIVAEASRGWKLLQVALRYRRDVLALSKSADDATALKTFEPLGRQLYELGNCPDYVINRGHYFGTDRFTDPTPGAAQEPGLNESDKKALIAFLKTF